MYSLRLQLGVGFYMYSHSCDVYLLMYFLASCTFVFALLSCLGCLLICLLFAGSTRREGRRDDAVSSKEEKIRDFW